MWFKSYCVTTVAVVYMYCTVHVTILLQSNCIQKGTSQKGTVDAELLPNSEAYKSGLS